ncbi:MAG: hypothetical protein HXY51_11845 [Nitrospirae bacterium]|nr:hypothetical protein [Nitrospirota bacterium]
MVLQRPITDRIFEALRTSSECEFEALITRYPEFTANELLAEVSRLSRAGQVKIMRGVGTCTIKHTPVIK